MNEEQNSHNRDDDQKNWLEWLVFGVSLLLLLSIVGYLTYKVFTEEATDPDIYAEAVKDPSEYAPNRYHVRVYNKGGSTAEEVIVEFILYKKGEEVESSELQIAFSPKNSEQEGWVVFRNDTALADSVVARVVSYKKP